MPVHRGLGPDNRPGWCEVTSAGIFKVPRDGWFDRHYHDFNEYWLVFKGRAKVLSEGQEYVVGPGEINFHAPNFPRFLPLDPGIAVPSPGPAESRKIDFLARVRRFSPNKLQCSEQEAAEKQPRIHREPWMTRLPDHNLVKNRAGIRTARQFAWPPVSRAVESAPRPHRSPARVCRRSRPSGCAYRWAHAPRAKLS